MVERDVERFVSEYFKEIVAGNAAIFAGAGLSAPAGYVDWRGLLRPLAEELSLDIDKETDLVAVAQFHVNANKNNRGRLNAAVIEALSADNPPTLNHRILSNLPVFTWWTTNYDKLIETALREAGKIVDVKDSVPTLATTKPRRDAIIYKMHGDVDRPHEATITRDDYERYHKDKGAFINALAGDLVSKTFLFVGFSFTDPNLEHVLSHVRVSYEQNQRRHFAIFRRRAQLDGETEDEFEYAKIRQSLIIEDLLRFNIKAVLVDEYSEITEIFSELHRRYRSRIVFISASASNFEPWGQDHVTEFMRELGSELVSRGMIIATGLGLGVGNALFTGALERVVGAHLGAVEDYLIARPFPQAIDDENARQRAWAAYREDIIGRTGIAVFLFGNKVRPSGEVIEADGMRKEFEIAERLGVICLPIGATGSTARTLHEEFQAKRRDDKSSLAPKLAALGDDKSDLIKLAPLIADIVVSARDRG
jgi:NAD-dependent SIR2 family protein deacetylase